MESPGASDGLGFFVSVLGGEDKKQKNLGLTSAIGAGATLFISIRGSRGYVQCFFGKIFQSFHLDMISGEFSPGLRKQPGSKAP
jgi:hypothetical protein